MHLQKWHWLEWLTKDEILIPFIQDVTKNYPSEENFKTALKTTEWVLRLRRPRMRLWLFKLHLQVKRAKRNDKRKKRNFR